MKHPIAGLALCALATASSSHVTPAGPAERDLIYQQLEQEKLNDQIWKAYFPSLDIARKAAISFHAQLLESHYEQGYLIMELDAAEMDRLRPFGFRFERAAEFIERRNRALVQAQIRQALGAPAGLPAPTSIPGYSCYETVEETFTVADGLVAARPTLASWVDAGDSWQKTQGAGGYDMRVLKLSNNAVTGDKPKLFINSAIHAREYTTAPLVLEFARWLVNGHGTDADATWLLDHHEVHVMLHSNPDGRKKAETGLSWRKNVNNNHCSNTNNRGVDLNRNFSATWNSTGGQGSSGNACDLTYRGVSAGSEPETQASESYIRSLWPDRRGPGLNDPAPSDTSGVHLDIHSYSRLVLWPWGETAAPAPNGPALQTMGRRLAWFNGYTPQQSIGLYPTDGTSDAPSYQELGVAAFTIELGTAFFESCTTYNSTVKPANLPALIYAAKVARTPYITPGGPDITTLLLGSDASGAGVVAGTEVSLSASATDTRFNNSNGTEATQAIAGAEYSVDLPYWNAAAVAVPLAPSDGSFNATTEALIGGVPTFGLANGKHLLFVRARDAGGTWGPVSAAFLNIIGQPASVSEVEPNGQLASAQAVATVPAVVSGGFDTPTRQGARADADVYRITLPAGRTLRATLTQGASTRASLELLDASGARLAYSAQAVGVPNSASYTNATGSALTLYAKASYLGGAFGSFAGLYTLTLGQ